MLIGVPFAFLGVAMLAGAILGRVEGDVAVAWFVGGIFALVGLGLVVGRSRTVIDREQGTFVRTLSLLFPAYRKERRLEEFDQVSLVREIRRTKNGSYVVFCTYLTGNASKEKWAEIRDYVKARAAAEEVAKFLTWPLVDGTGDEVVVREPEHLDESLRDRVHRLGERVDVTAPAAGTKIKFWTECDDYVMELPRGWLFWLAREKVTASPGRLRVEARHLLHSSVTEIPADELEELELLRWGGCARRIQARSDESVTTFGGSLSDDELRWVHDVIMKVMTR